MALLPADPKQRKQFYFLILLLIGGLVWVFITYVSTPREERITQMEGRLSSLEAKNRRAKLEAARHDDLKKRMELYERQLRIFEEFIPQSEEIPELLDAISAQAQLTNVELARFGPQQTEAGEYYTKLTRQLSVLGEYHDVGRFLTRVASLTRVIKPTGVQIGPAPRNRATRDMKAPLEVSFTIETFVLGDLAAAATS